MAIRTIDYTVSLSGISPATQQFGGVQGEHNATELKFILNSDLLASIKAQAGENEVVYRFDIYDGTGGLTSTDSAPLTDSPPSYLLENKVSRMGGNVQVFLIITEIKDGETQMDLYSFPAVLRLKEKQEGEVNEAENYESISTLAEVAKKSASIAENSASIAKEAQIKTEESKLALESGAEFVFLGGDSKSEVKTDLIVDGVLSPVSKNAVENQAVAKEFLKYMPTSEADNRYLKFDDADNRYLKFDDADNRYLKFDDVANYMVESGFANSTSNSSVIYYEKYSNGIIKAYTKVPCTVLAAGYTASGVFIPSDCGILRNSIICCNVSMNVGNKDETANRFLSTDYVYRPKTQPSIITVVVHSTYEQALSREEDYSVDIRVVGKWK